MTGTSDTTFEPDVGTSRAMFVVVLARIEGVQVDNSAATSFDDVIAGEWYAGAVAWAADSGIVFGTSDTTFEPHVLITREQMATMIARYVEFAGVDLPEANEEVTYADHDSISSYAKQAVKTCQIAGIMIGIYNNFEPQSNSLRAQVAVIFTRLINVTYTVTFESDKGSEVASQTINFGGKVTAPDNPTRLAYTFDGWYTDPTLTNSYDFNAAVKTNLTLYAKWIADINSNIGNYRLDFDVSNWSYDSVNNVYYQIDVPYCSDPDTLTYETMGIYVPGDYMTAVDNRDDTYTCSIDGGGEINGYTASSAPMVIPVNTPGYSAMTSPTSYNYDTVSSYLQEGYIYVFAGCRGRNNGTDFDGGAPWGVTDLKAAIRYVRYNSDILPGNTDRIFTFGMSGGGAQSSLVGATGDSDLYYSYLESIGAAAYDKDGDYISDAIYGAMCWCPITSLDYADAAYEWMMGQYFENESWTTALSDDLSKAFAQYINELGIMDEQGNVLALANDGDYTYTSGSYYEYLLGQIELSLNNYLSDNYSGNTTGAETYIASINRDNWITYDSTSNTATITSVAAFVINCKHPEKKVGAFDGLDRSKAENFVFGDHINDALHFDAVMAGLLQENAETYKQYSGWDDTYVKDYQEYKTSVDRLGNDSLHRQNMYNPMYYLCDYYEGYRTSTPAAHWRINTGINQTDTSLTVEMNLALALEQYDGVEDVDFSMVWAQAHTQAERTGTSSGNFIAWVNDICQN